MAGIDRNFIHYGIRTQDLELICQLAESNELDTDWLKEEILKVYHEQRVSNVEIDDNSVEKIINKALNRIAR